MQGGFLSNYYKGEEEVLRAVWGEQAMEQKPEKLRHSAGVDSLQSVTELAALHPVFVRNLASSARWL